MLRQAQLAKPVYFHLLDVCAIKPAQDSKYKKLARPQERKFRLFRASFVLAVLKYN